MSRLSVSRFASFVSEFELKCFFFFFINRGLYVSNAENVPKIQLRAG